MVRLRQDHGFVVTLFAGVVVPADEEEARHRLSVRLRVVRGLDCGGLRTYHLFGPAGELVPEPWVLKFAPRSPTYADLRLRVIRDRLGRAVWAPMEPLLSTNC